MSSSALDLFDSAYEVIETHGSFYHPPGQSEATRNFIPVEAIEALTWLAVNVALPILTGVGTSVVTERLKDRRQSSAGPPSERPSVDALEREVADVLRRSRTRAESADASKAAAASVRELLQTHGWTTDVADRDAAAIVSSIVNKLDAPRG